jgi:hypothetical protein
MPVGPRGVAAGRALPCLGFRPVWVWSDPEREGVATTLRSRGFGLPKDAWVIY